MDDPTAIVLVLVRPFVRPSQGCLNRRPTVKITVRTSTDIRPRPRLSHGCGFTRGRVLTVRGRGKNRVRASASTWTWGIPAGAGPRRPAPARTWYGRAHASARTRDRLWTRVARPRGRVCADVVLGGAKIRVAAI
jgi:hypothetical protein